MKKIILTLLLILTTATLKSESSFHLGISAGLALPNDKISQFYNDTKQKMDADSLSSIGTYFKKTAADAGYTVNVKGHLRLSDNIEFTPSIGIIRFNEGEYGLEVPYENKNDTAKAKVQSTTNIIPISLGLNAYLFRSFISLYGTANVCYNYTTYSYDVNWSNYPAVPISTSEPISRLGYSVGGGIEFDLSIISLSFEATYNTHNIIGKSSEEPTKNYGMFTVGVIF
ncbi:MAG: outer membrane beta-barrel protein [Ignavibacteria bacterium]|jgi:hypothetical protein|nr:outer membrane beta-barrel protein [Ignavibacteria bacterium]